MMQPSTLPAESLFKGFIRAYYVGTHTADIQLAASPRETIAGVRVATHIHAADAVVDRECTVLFFGAANCQDAVVIGVQGALPSGGGGGVTDHGALTGLGDDDHAQYALLAGRAAAQTFIGATASGGHLTLQSTAHATRGYVRAQDDVQLLSGYLRDSAGNARIQLATASPHIAITGDTDVSGHIAVGTGIMDAQVVATISDSIDLPTVAAGRFEITGTRTLSSGQITYGLLGGASGAGTPSGNAVYGLYFYADHNSASACAILTGIYVQVSSSASGSGAIATSRGLHVEGASWISDIPATMVGVDIADQGGGGGTGTCYGLRIADQTGATNRLIQAGPSTPYLRLVGGAAPAANCTHLWLGEGVTPTLRNVQWKLYSALVAGDRVCVLV